MKCPYCHFENEEGVLFCEQCKSDLGILESTGIPEIRVEVAPLAEAMPAMPLAAELVEGDVLVANLAPPDADDVQGLAAPDTGMPVQETLKITSPLLQEEELASPPTEPLDQSSLEALAAQAAARAAQRFAENNTPVTAPTLSPRLVVTRGQKINEEFPLFEGENYIGRADEKPVDIDLEPQEHPERVWTSRQHAVVMLDAGTLTIEDLNSSNGTFVNRSRIQAGDRYPLKNGDVIQVGTVQLKVKM